MEDKSASPLPGELGVDRPMILLWPQKLDWTIGFDMFKRGNLVTQWSAVKVGKRHLTAGETTTKGPGRGDLAKCTSYEVRKLSAGHGIIILNRMFQTRRLS
ncbi:hypothetical protein V8C34DRAFT_293849 [Trichoderma compactum]